MVVHGVRINAFYVVLLITMNHGHVYSVAIFKPNCTVCLGYSTINRSERMRDRSG